MDVDEAFADRFRQARERRSLSLADIASRLDELGYPMDRRTIQRIERTGKTRERRRVTLSEALALSTAVEVPLLALLLPVAEDTVEVGNRQVPTWQAAAWITGHDVPHGGHVAEEAAPVEAWRSIRQYANAAAAARQRLARHPDDDEATAALEWAFENIDREADVLSELGVTVSGAVPSWLLQDFLAWRDEAKRGRPPWAVAYMASGEGWAAGSITNRRGEQRRVWVQDDEDGTHVSFEEDDRG